MYWRGRRIELNDRPNAGQRLYYTFFRVNAYRPHLLTLARRHGIAVPAEDVAGLREWFRFRDFTHFVDTFALLRACLKDPADYELVTYELGAELAAQNVRYAELTFTPGRRCTRAPAKPSSTA